MKARSVTGRCVAAGCCAVPCEAPQDEAQTAVGIQADGNLARGVEFTLQLYGAAQRADGCVRDLQKAKRCNKIWHLRGIVLLILLRTEQCIREVMAVLNNY